MLPVLTRTRAKHKTREKSVRRDEEIRKKNRNHSFVGDCLFVASAVHLLSLPFVPKQLWIEVVPRQKYLKFN